MAEQQTAFEYVILMTLSHLLSVIGLDCGENAFKCNSEDKCYGLPQVCTVFVVVAVAI